MNLASGKTQLFPTDPEIQPPFVGFISNNAFSGYLVSDGTLIRSKMSDGVVQFQRGSEPIGLPLSNIALLSLSERAGTFVVVGSDGSDTYCGPPEPSGPKAGSLAGDSVQITRKGVSRVGEFESSFQAPAIHASGGCTLAQSFETDTPSIRIDSIVDGSSFVLPNDSDTGSAHWIE